MGSTDFRGSAYHHSRMIRRRFRDSIFGLEELMGSQRVPRHVAIIMDGNGRWAVKQGLQRIEGHRRGAKRVREIVEEAGKLNLEVLTLYAFSTENWRRSPQEVSALMNLLASYLESEIDELNRKNVKLTSIGERHRLPRACQESLAKAERLTSNNNGLRLILALSYGSRNDIVQSCREICRQVAGGTVDWHDVDEKFLASHLSTWDVPDPDLFIRTSGEERLSNFLLWEAAYAEFYFSPVAWPDFSKEQFKLALEDYRSRDRRFGAEMKVVDGNESQPGGLGRC